MTFFRRFTPHFILFIPVTTNLFYFFVIHHCKNSYSSLHIFIHRCTFSLITARLNKPCLKHCLFYFLSTKVLYWLQCIVLYLYIYIELFRVNNNQKHFPCKRSREKRAVLREQKEALGSPVNKEDHYHSAESMIAKARV